METKAHDINAALAAVTGAPELAATEPPNRDELRELAHEVDLSDVDEDAPPCPRCWRCEVNERALVFLAKKLGCFDELCAHLGLQ